MIIYGTALLALCHLLGIFLGDLLGQALGVRPTSAAWASRCCCSSRRASTCNRKGILPKLTELGVEYWGAMYIPVVVAMAAQQDMVSALRGGPVALLSALAAVAVCAVVISLINRMEHPVASSQAEPVRNDNPLLNEAE